MPSTPRNRRLAATTTTALSAHSAVTSAAFPRTPHTPPDTTPGDKLLETRIRERIEHRLGDRIRRLAVCVADGAILLQGECSTSYSKQLAQHAALGVIEDERLENAIEVKAPC